jgi:hypothetical protein
MEAAGALKRLLWPVPKNRMQFAVGSKQLRVSCLQCTTNFGNGKL